MAMQIQGQMSTAEPVKEYADEWISKYVPTSHVERITVGGTAFFAPEEEK